MSISQATVKHLYSTVIEDVLANCREAFLDDGVDDSVLQELKTLWEGKLLASKAVLVNPDPLDPQPPPLPKNSKPGGAKKSQTVQPVPVQPVPVPVPAAVENTGETSVPPLAGTVTNNGGTMPLQATNVVNPQTLNNVHQTMVAPNHVNQISRPMNQVIQNQPMQTATLVSNQQMQPAMLHQQQLQQQQPQPPPPPQLQPQPPPAQLAMVPITITLPSVDSAPRSITIQVPPAAVSGDSSIYSTILSQVLTGPLISAALQLPPTLATNLVQQHVTAAYQGLLSQYTTAKQEFPQAVEQNNPISQLDGALDSTDEDDDDDDDDDDDIDDDDENDKDEDENDENEGGAEEEPLNSGDDVSDDDPTELFETDNVVVCQYDKITRSRNKWKFYLKDGIMNLNGKDYIFQRANGDAEW